MIEKYLTYCKNIYIDDVMKWRVRFLNCQFPRQMKVILQFRMLIQKGIQKEKTTFRIVDDFDDGPGELRKDYENLGDKVTKTPPLLDPNLSLQEAKDEH